MFETANLSYGPPTKRLLATCAGVSGQAMLIGFALLAPMIWPQVIPHVAEAIAIVPPGVPPGRAADTAKVVPARGTKAARATKGDFTAPAQVPKTKPIMLVDGPDDFAPVRGHENGPGVVGSPWSGENDRIAVAIAREAQVLPTRVPQPTTQVRLPVVTAQPEPARRISVVCLASPIHRIDPAYPPLAVTARIQGKVRLIGVLGTDGRIRELQVLSGHPLLVKAALEAVQQWVYAPMLLNGQPVEVQAPIEVNFVLNR
jgi:protein TonB